MSSTAITGSEQPATDRHSTVPSVETVRERGLAEVIPLAHARELANSSKASEGELASFAAIVRELEILDGRPLHGSGRDDCERAFSKHPYGFRAAIDESRAANVERRCGLLVKLVRDGWHVAADEIARAKAAAPAEPASLLETRLAERDGA